MVSCLLEKARLSPDLRYAAISYAWGDQPATREILVNGAAFPVTENLASGLWHFRKYGITPRGPSDEIPLWIDAVCINQDDIPDRNEQVSMMRSIYSGASYAVAWLGIPAGRRDIGECLRLMKDFAASLPADLKSTVVATYDTGGNKSWEHWGAEFSQKGLDWIAARPELHDDGASDSPPAAWSSFRELTRPPYWERVWVLQERVLSKSFTSSLFRVGGDLATLVDLLLFFHLIVLLDREGRRPPQIGRYAWKANASPFHMPIVHPVLRLRDIGEMGRAYPEFVVWAASFCRASDPRDMVYGALGVLNMRLRPDYSKSVREVYLEWHEKLVEERVARNMRGTCWSLPLAAQGWGCTGITPITYPRGYRT